MTKADAAAREKMRETWEVDAHGHRIDPSLGEVHDLRCEDCGRILGRRQLPPGRDPDEDSGAVCTDPCMTERRMRAAAGLPERKPGIPLWRRARDA